MRVSHIVKATRISGAESHLLALIAGLRERDVQVSLQLLVEPERPMEDMLAQARALGVPAQSTTLRRDMDPGALWELRAQLRSLQPDLVHTHLVHADIYGFVAAKMARRLPVVSSRHAGDRFRLRPRWRRIHQLLWQRLDAGIAISHAIKDFAIAVEGAPAEKITVIHYGLRAEWQSDTEITAARRRLCNELDLPDEALLLGLVCRLVEEKGVHYALDALRQIKLDFPQAQLVIAGDGEKAAELKRLSAALGIADSVYWLGWRDDVADLMSAFDLLIFPSLWEGFGLVLLEAMAARLPIVASRVSAIPEVVIDGETGLLFEPRDVSGLVNALTRLLEDRALRKYMGLLGAARLEEHFSIERMVEDTLAVYDAVLGNAGRHRHH